MRVLLSLLLFSALVAASSPALASDQTELEKARIAYGAHNYTDAESRVMALLDPKSGSKDALVISTARMYEGAIWLARSNKREAALSFERLLLDDAQFEPDPLAFPPDVVSVFIDTRAALRERLAQLAQAQARAEAARRAQSEQERRRETERVKKLEQLAREESVTTFHSRVLAAVPFGVGQFQNGNNGLGYFFLGLESALVIGSLVTVPIYNNARERERDEFVLGDPTRVVDQYHARADAARVVNWSLLGGLIVAAGIGVAQAQVAYSPAKKEIIPRKIDIARVHVSPFGVGVEF